VTAPESWPSLETVAPELVAMEALESSIDVVADLLDDLYPGIDLDEDADSTIRGLVVLLSKCRAALDDYYFLRTSGRPSELLWDEDDDIPL